MSRKVLEVRDSIASRVAPETVAGSGSGGTNFLFDSQCVVVDTSGWNRARGSTEIAT
jgi:hypothetical protein